MPFVQSVCRVQCGHKRAVIAAAGVDVNKTPSPQGHITPRRALTREKSHGAGKNVYVLILTDLMRKYKS